ncbi:MAG: AAA family ATPase [Pseudomonadota bacterium]|nr:AAA family ATPase [Pseudomonadota bacterium]
MPSIANLMPTRHNENCQSTNVQYHVFAQRRQFARACKMCSMYDKMLVFLYTMIPRSLNLPRTHSFFLFGARGTGKSTLLGEMFPADDYYHCDLLNPRLELRYLHDPMRLLEDWQQASARQRTNNWIVVDEVQKIPKLLDLVQLGITKHGLKFALTGSSAAKLRQSNSNLLAGRALTYELYPFSAIELGDRFELEDAINYGLLPQAVALREDTEARRNFLASYVNTYLHTEIQAAGLVRKLEPFWRFLQVAAQANGTVLNIARLARQAQVERQTAHRYFILLQDSLIGFLLPSYHRSERLKQAGRPKFYFFDPGVARAATASLEVKLQPSSYEFGRFFEHLVILEAIKTNNASGKRFSFFYLPAGDGGQTEIDLIAVRGKQVLAIEIKSTTDPDITDIRRLARTSRKITDQHPYIFCRTQQPSVREGVHVLPWQQGIAELYKIQNKI